MRDSHAFVDALSNASGTVPLDIVSNEWATKVVLYMVTCGSTTIVNEG